MTGRAPSVAEFTNSIQALPVEARPFNLRRRVTMGQYRKVYALTREFIGDAQQVLDWGCGIGHFSRYLLDAGCNVTGYSYEEPPSFVHRDPRFHFVHGTPNEPVRLPFADASFDAAFSIGVLEHVHEMGGNQQGSFDELLRVLKPGGRLFVFHFPNAGSWIEVAARVHKSTLSGEEKVKRHVHSRLFRLSDVKGYLQSQNAELLAVGRYNIIPRNSWLKLPTVLSDSALLAGIVNVMDDTLGAVLPMFVQNWYFIVEKAKQPAS